LGKIEIYKGKKFNHNITKNIHMTVEDILL